ncbi:hypothetical protein CHARACLAT_014454, partial [Characodon lateralis]|nr:hypothetical protein [Characodon lateralis]
RQKESRDSDTTAPAEDDVEASPASSLFIGTLWVRLLGGRHQRDVTMCQWMFAHSEGRR